ncbi:uncharacterized protein LOC113344438 [Papaver somniferum]|uniref:uncharacterized protein LOC113344438 n=1 Tax=Papaver somniferum TaxID=3469 RepID=UPI000E6F6454|nr:uncharacterized protein LOC113344438 [Papaver somniferum]
MRYKPGLKLSESSQFKFRNISVYAEPKNETLVFPDCHRDETELMTLKYMVYKGLSMDVKEKFNLYWFKEECLPLPLLNNDEFDNFWEDSFVNEDGCICLWMGMKDTVFGTPKTTPKKKTVSKGTTPRRAETKENWIIFLKHLKDAILAHPVKVAFISDRQKGLLEAVGIVFPCHHHRYCWRSDKGLMLIAMC